MWYTHQYTSPVVDYQNAYVEKYIIIFIKYTLFYSSSLGLLYF